MTPRWRHAMVGLHTWAGVCVGTLLFVIFWMGSLSVFDREIDRWMMPATRLPAPSGPPSLDATVLPVAARLAGGASPWTIVLPSARVPAIELRYTDAQGEPVRRHIDPASGALLPEAGSLGASGFFFPFHFRLHLRFADIGYWLVGVAGMAMLVLLVSGVIVHRRIFSDFFTFRPRRALPRATLDVHNLSGVLALPFHFVITLSGLIIFFAIYFPSAYQMAYAGAAVAPRAAFDRDAFGTWQRPASGQPGQLASLDAMLATARDTWQGREAYFVRVWHPGDAAAYVELRRSVAEGIPMNVDRLVFDGASGRLLHRHKAQPVMAVQRFIAGLHFIQFRHGLLRALYFVAGLAGCVMIASGLLFWLAARRRRAGGVGMRLVDALTVGGTTGTILATLAFLIANRVLPGDGAARAALEMQVFFAVWVLGFCHAGLRPEGAWRVQSRAIGVAAAVAVVLNALTTGMHPLAAMAGGQWAVAGVDGVLLLTAALAWGVARRGGRQPASAASAVAGADHG
ncbi:PepSY-associated TM helix domain-containing protein [Denitromonas iodatirespirans]|uniref:PepSY domain-containing protein n=1 Tax=Denitromonas iodatirespirans TaxID=2795389 RepID=A0A944D6D5_DENI1|nr:PepSY-associated TM helix domain-containing protein [Denitromonas iodatirespirans]MBT0960825.1 PepSY domain-containing protein [Denitromonas iodatirespirans]